jgi:hypothetical protein
MNPAWEEFVEDLVFFARGLLGAAVCCVALLGLTWMIGGRP